LRGVSNHEASHDHDRFGRRRALKTPCDNALRRDWCAPRPPSDFKIQTENPRTDFRTAGSCLCRRWTYANDLPDGASSKTARLYSRLWTGGMVLAGGLVGAAGAGDALMTGGGDKGMGPAVCGSAAALACEVRCARARGDERCSLHECEIEGPAVKPTIAPATAPTGPSTTAPDTAPIAASAARSCALASKQTSKPAISVASRTIRMEVPTRCRRSRDLGNAAAERSRKFFCALKKSPRARFRPRALGTLSMMALWK
jgi:hypothetical protein